MSYRKLSELGSGVSPAFPKAKKITLEFKPETEDRSRAWRVIRVKNN